MTATSKETSEWLKHKLFDPNPKYLVREEGVFYLSELLYCASKLVFNIKFHSVNPPNAVMLRGSLLHERLINFLSSHPDYKNAEYEKGVKVYENDDFIIKGRADIVHDGIVDEWKFGEKPASGWDMGIASYLAQASEYAYALKLKEARLYYVNLRTFEIWDWTIKPLEDVHHRIVDKAKRIYDNINNGIVPDWDSPIFKNECDQCSYSLICLNFLGERTQREKDYLSNTFAIDVDKNSQLLKTRMQDLNGLVQAVIGQKASKGEIESNTFDVQKQAIEAGYN